MSNIHSAAASTHYFEGGSMDHPSHIFADPAVNGFDSVISRAVTWIVEGCNTIKDLWASLLLRIKLFLGLDPASQRPAPAAPPPLKLAQEGARLEASETIRPLRLLGALEASDSSSDEESDAVLGVIYDLFNVSLDEGFYRVLETSDFSSDSSSDEESDVVLGVIYDSFNASSDEGLHAVFEVTNRAFDIVEEPRVSQHTQITELSEVQLLSLSEEDVQSIHYDSLLMLPQGTQDNLGFGKINQLSVKQAGKLVSNDLNWLVPVCIYGIDASIINALSEECVKGLSASVLNNLNLVTIATIDTGILVKISPNTLKGLKSRFLNALPLDPSTIISKDRKKHLSARAEYWSGHDLRNVLAPAIQDHIKSGKRLYWVDA